MIEGDVAARIAELKANQNRMVWGSPTLVQFLADRVLVDDYKLLVPPIFRGRGAKLFAATPAQIELKVEGRSCSAAGCSPCTGTGGLIRSLLPRSAEGHDRR